MSDNVNTLFPYRPGYQRPDHRVNPEHHFPLTAGAVTADGSAVEQAHAAITNAQAQFEKHLSSINPADYTTEGAQKRINEFALTDAAKAVESAVTSVRERRDKAAARIEHLRRELSPNGDAAAEQRAIRYWNRTLRLLDKQDTGRLFKAANDLMAKATREELGTLLQELGPYLESRNVPTDWIDGVLANHVPEYRKARKQLSSAEKALAVTQFNAKQIRDRFALSSPAAYRKPIFVAPQDDPDR